MEIDVIIPSYFGLEYVDRCLESISEHMPMAKIIVVDNNSSDGTAKYIRGKFPEVTVIENEYNSGYSRGCNIGALNSSSEFMMFLNQDSEISKIDLPGLEESFKSKNIGIITGPVLDEKGNSIATIGRPMGILGILKSWAFLPLIFLGFSRFSPLYAEESESFFAPNGYWISGHLMIVRRSLFEELSGWDEGFFAYVVDTDFCNRVQNLGFEVLFSSNVVSIDLNGLRNNTSEMTRFVVHDSLLGQGRFISKKHGVLIGTLCRTICSLIAINWGIFASLVFLFDGVRRKSSLNLIVGGFKALVGTKSA